MTALLYGAAALTLLLAGVGLLRVFAGPTRADRMLGVQLSATLAVGTLLLLSEATGEAALLDVALVLALLGAVGTVAFTRPAAWGADE